MRNCQFRIFLLYCNVNQHIAAMKNTLRLLLITAAFVVCNLYVSTAGTRKKNKEIAKIQAGIAELEHRQTYLELAINRATIEKYIELNEERRSPILIFGLKTFDPEKLWDTIPHIAILHSEYYTANYEMIAILERDSLYLKAKEIPRTDKARSQIISDAFNRLYKENPEYREARELRESALRDQNVAITRFLLDYYHSQGKQMPVKGLISTTDLNLINQNQAIKSMNTDLMITTSSIFTLKQKMLDVKYDLRSKKL